MKWLLLIALGACGKKSEPAAGSAPPPPNINDVQLPGELAAWHTGQELKAWQGAFTTELVVGDPLAAAEELVLDVVDDGAKAFDGTKEYPLGLSIIAPCVAEFVQITGADRDAIVPSTRKFFAIQNGDLIVSFGGIGRRKGKAAIVCQPGVDLVVTLDDKGTCKTWDTLDGWRSKPIECAWSKTDDGKDRLVIDKIEFVAEGDVLMDTSTRVQLSRNKTIVRHASYEAAKQALAAHKATRK